MEFLFTCFAEGIELSLSDVTGKDKNKNPILLDDGNLWSHPAFAMSSRGLPSNIVNGQTPQGVHTIDSVMPEANRQIAFGKFRRLILNWVRGDFSERGEMAFLPQTLSILYGGDRLLYLKK